MNLGGNLKRLGLGFLDLVFPISCITCGADQTYLCKKCESNFPRMEKQFCAVCHEPAPFGKTHPDCASKNNVDGSISALPYTDPDVKKIIGIFKYNFIADLAPILSSKIIETINSQGLINYFSSFEIVPIPLHYRRFNWRGFNQAEILAKPLSESLGIKLNPNMVSRIKNTRPQVNLNAAERKQNIDNAFMLNGPAEGKSILLVDDVITSGSTANELARLLKKNHAKTVWIITAAHG